MLLNVDMFPSRYPLVPLYDNLFVPLYDAFPLWDVEFVLPDDKNSVGNGGKVSESALSVANDGDMSVGTR